MASNFCERHTNTLITHCDKVSFYTELDLSIFLSLSASLSLSLPQLLGSHILDRNFYFSPVFFRMKHSGVINSSPAFPSLLYTVTLSILTTITLAYTTNTCPWDSEISSELVPSIQVTMRFVPNHK